jgi:predicted kinase
MLPRRTIAIMRGLPGSGKSTYAKELAEWNRERFGARCAIVSADQYFTRNGIYMFNVARIVEAHAWVADWVARHVSRGLDFIVIDNTHVCRWHFEHIYKYVENGYDVACVEPRTDLWLSTRNQLANRDKSIAQLYVDKTTHGVSLETIQAMIEAWEE